MGYGVMYYVDVYLFIWLTLENNKEHIFKDWGLSENVILPSILRNKTRYYNWVGHIFIRDIHLFNFRELNAD